MTFCQSLSKTHDRIGHVHTQACGTTAKHATYTTNLMAAPSQADETEDVGAMCNLLLLSPSKRLQKSLSQETALRVLAVLRRRNAAGQSVLEKMCYKTALAGT